MMEDIVGKHSSFRTVTMASNIGQVRKWGKFPHILAQRSPRSPPYGDEKSEKWGQKNEKENSFCFCLRNRIKLRSPELLLQVISLRIFPHHPLAGKLWNQRDHGSSYALQPLPWHA